MDFAETVERVGMAIDAAGVLVVVAGLAWAFLRFALPGWRAAQPFRQLRQDMGRGILLGLELLVAADIVRTVAVAPTMDKVLVLAVIVLVRTFLSITLQVEIEGRWPWQRGSGEPARADV